MDTKNLLVSGSKRSTEQAGLENAEQLRYTTTTAVPAEAAPEQAAPAAVSRSGKVAMVRRCTQVRTSELGHHVMSTLCRQRGNN
jgi:hypothetical protein